MEQSLFRLRNALFLIAGVGITSLTACQSKDQDTGDSIEQDEDGDGETVSQGDCNDQDSAINTSAQEVCDGVDNNCDGAVDEDVLIVFYEDLDGDGFGTESNTFVACAQPEGYAMESGDCDDQSVAVSPGQDEVCDGIDNNCDGIVDDNTIGADTWYADTDGDTFGSEEDVISACTQPEGYVEQNGDCNDQDFLIHPMADEICDEVDNNCDGQIDNDAVDASEWYLDEDADGYGVLNDTLIQCSQPEGYTDQFEDCDDQNASVYPNAEEVEDGLDNDCDSIIDNPVCPSAPLATSSSMVINSPQTYTFCSPIPLNGVCPAVDYGVAMQAVVDTIGPPPPSCFWDLFGDLCGPTSVTTECCYTVQSVSPSCIAVGRPFIVDGEMTVASLSVMNSWVSEKHASIELALDIRNEVIAHWKKAAQEEHASIASFSRLTMQLMALGAPPELLHASIQAQSDELSHAKACLHVVSLLSGTSYGFDGMRIAGAQAQEPTLNQLLVDSILEGCINETLAAAEAAYLSKECTHSKISKVLKAIAKDEEQHAALGWKIVAWCIEQDSSLAQVVFETFQQQYKQWEDRLIHPEGEKRIQYGQLSHAKARSLHKYVWNEIIMPCAESISYLPRQSA